ncbi:hypothetical protein D9M68_987900 [compost metagenome]
MKQPWINVRHNEMYNAMKPMMLTRPVVLSNWAFAMATPNIVFSRVPSTITPAPPSAKPIIISAGRNRTFSKKM